MTQYPLIFWLLNLLGLVGRAVLDGFAIAGRMSIFAGRCFGASLSIPLYFGQIFQQIVRIGYFSLPVIGLTAGFIGAALALNIYIGGARFNAEQFVPNIVVVGITRELGPVLASLMLAGRVSAGIAAEIGAMRVTEQIDALKTLSASPFRFLYAPRLIAAIITLPLLVACADIIGVMGGYLVATMYLGFDGITYLNNTIDFVTVGDIASGLIKAAVFGATIAVMGCYYGHFSGGGASGVGRSATLAVVTTAVLIFAFNYLLTSIFVRFGL